MLRLFKFVLRTVSGITVTLNELASWLVTVRQIPSTAMLVPGLRRSHRSAGAVIVSSEPVFVLIRPWWVMMPVNIGKDWCMCVSYRVTAYFTMTRVYYHYYEYSAYSYVFVFKN